ncbi:MAG: lamin tail domain-containing protein, partial [bacterium]|nr:lamin tail domain-containing protein [bacterium]
MHTSRNGGHSGLRVILAMLLVLAAAFSARADVLINETDADTPSTDVLEFVELYGTPSQSLNGLVLVFYNGSNDLSYAAYDLDGYSLDANGFFLLGNAGVVPTPSIIFGSNFLQNGQDAVALYSANGTDFPNNTPVTATNLVDAIVYDTADADDLVLLATLTPGQPQIDENGNANGANESCQRSPDGAGGPLVTTSYVVQLPSPGVSNGGVMLQDPDVANVYHRSLLPTPGEAVTVYADATDNDGTVTEVRLYWQVNGAGATSAVMTLSEGSTYAGTIPGAADGSLVEYFVEATDNDGLFGTSPATGFYGYTVAPEAITPIASVHADSLGYAGDVIMVQGQVYIPGDYKADGVTVSAYIQDTAGRGLNIFGTTRSTGAALLNATGNIVKVTGTAYWFGTTVELVNYEVELVSGGNTPLAPALQTTGAAAAAANEGSYVAAVAPITAISVTTGTNPAHNFTIDDGSGPVVVRVDDDLAPGLETWLVGDELEAAGAGGTYANAGQIIAGLAADLVNNGQGPDVTPPTLVNAALDGTVNVLVQFSEAVAALTAEDEGNYEVYQTAVPGNTVAVVSAVLQTDASQVLLTVAASLSGTPHTVRVNDVQDVAGNPIAANSTAAISDLGPLPRIEITEVMQNPLLLADTDGEWFEIRNAGTTAVDLNGWTIMDTGLDSHVIDNGGPLVINPGEYKVLGVNATVMAGEGVTLFYQYAGVLLSNADDELILVDTFAREVDAVMWDGGPVWPDPTGASMAWSGVGDNNVGTNWAESTAVFGTGDLGTPGAANGGPTAAPPALATLLGANYPNPFNPSTKFSFSLDHDAQVSLAVFDLRGHLVRTVVEGRLAAGD